MDDYSFPRNVRLPHLTYASAAKPEDVRRAYERWKNELVTSDGANGHLRVIRPNTPDGYKNSTVSEGIAYGMIIAVMLDDQTLFDELWKYAQHWANDNGLMQWYIDPSGSRALGSGGATDSDEDMAWALVMAARKWGKSSGLTSSYLDLAKTQIDLVYRYEVEHETGLLLPGDSWDHVVFNPSYFAPNQYRIFGQVSGNVEGWQRVIDTGYAMIEKSLSRASGNAENGLVPAWCDRDGRPTVPFPGGLTNYQYDSARTPFRIGQDYAYSKEPRAYAYLAKVSSFFAGVGAAQIVDGYDLDGTPRPDPARPADDPQSAVFVGCAAVGAMHDPRYQAFIDEAYALVNTGELLARSRYYNLSWTVLSLLMLSGNLVEYPE